MTKLLIDLLVIAWRGTHDRTRIGPIWLAPTAPLRSGSGAHCLSCRLDNVLR
jgi:hypothetical protein